MTWIGDESASLCSCFNVEHAEQTVRILLESDGPLQTNLYIACIRKLGDPDPLVPAKYRKVDYSPVEAILVVSFGASVNWQLHIRISTINEFLHYADL